MKKTFLFLFCFISFTCQVNALKLCSEYEASNCPSKDETGKTCFKTTNTCKEAYCEDYNRDTCPETVNGLKCNAEGSDCVTKIEADGTTASDGKEKTCTDYTVKNCPEKIGNIKCEPKNNSCLNVVSEDKSTIDEGRIEAITCTGNSEDKIPARVPMFFRGLYNTLKTLIPIFLIFLGIFDFVKAVISGNSNEMDASKGKFIRRIIAGIIIFLILSVIQWFFGLIGNSQNFMGCVSCFLTTENDCQEAGYIDPAVNDRQHKTPTKTPPKSTNTVKLESELNKTNASPSKGDGGILIIAGHSYAPYCGQVSNECREESGYKYLEPDQTRILAKLLKKELDNLNLKASIANEMLGGTDAKMNKSMYVENVLRTTAFKNNEPKFKKFSHVIELHFNAAGGGAHGTLLMLGGKGMSTIDKELKEAVVKYTGRSLDNISSGLKNINYFQGLNPSIPITYIEVEFYDNEAAMDNYYSNKEKIAKELAKVFKKHYGNKISR